MEFIEENPDYWWMNDFGFIFTRAGIGMEKGYHRETYIIDI
jgi:hypothetical protein